MAEAALKEVTAELTGLKNRVYQMVSAIFGESPYYLLKLYFCHHNVSRLLNLLEIPHRSTEQQSESKQLEKAQGGLHPCGETVYWSLTGSCHYFPS